MSYLVLARKWRPQRFDDVVGQRPVVKILQNALARERVPHAMIFSGVRGVGKTTLARIMAKAINCTGDGERPCNVCESCREITAGTALDLHEIDGASNRGIQEIRNLKEDLRFLPAKGRAKIYIIDEVHMLTTEAFNALLKTLEEPPAHVYFMFATTELHKVPVTILSRCQRYELQRLPFRELAAFFARVAEAEGVQLEERALEMVTREAQGSVRDGLSLLDQLFSFGGDTIDAAAVTDVLGLVDQQLFTDLVAALLAGDLAGALTLVDRACRAGAGVKRLAHDLLAAGRALLVAKVSSDPAQLLDCGSDELERWQHLAAAHDLETLSHLYQLMVQGVAEVGRAEEPRHVLELLCVRLCQAGRITPVAELLARLDQVLAGGPVSAPGAVASSPLPATPPPPPAASQTAPAASRPAPAGPQSAPASSPVPTAAKVAEEPPPAPAAKEQPRQEGANRKTAQQPAAPPPPPPPPPPAGEPRQVRQHWDAFIAYVKERKTWMAKVLQLCARTREEEGRLELVFEEEADFKVLQERENLQLLTEYVQDFFQRDLAVRFRSRSGAAAADDATVAAVQEERRALARDPLVQLVTDIFNGQVSNIRTGPRSR